MEATLKANAQLQHDLLHVSRLRGPDWGLSTMFKMML